MAYNIASNFNYPGITNYQGWLGGGYAGQHSYDGSGWLSASIVINQPGIYLATITAQFYNSPNAFVYITTNYGSTGSGDIPSYNTGLGYNVGAIGNYVNTDYFTNGTPGFSSNQVLAGSLQINGVSGSSAALTTTAPFYRLPGVNTTITFLINSQTSNSNNVYSYSIIRIG